jgi:hypothetical protein
LVTLARSQQPQWDLPKETERVLGLSLVGGVSECIQQWLMDDYRGDVESLIAANLIVFDGVIKVLSGRSGADDLPPV